MSSAIPEATIVASVDLVLGPGQRLVAVAEDGGLHTFTARPGASELQQADLSFTMADAVHLALAVFAGNEHAMTAPHTLRTLAATLVAAAAFDRGSR